MKEKSNSFFGLLLLLLLLFSFLFLFFSKFDFVPVWPVRVRVELERTLSDSRDPASSRCHETRERRMTIATKNSQPIEFFVFVSKDRVGLKRKQKMIAGITRSQTGPTKIRQCVTTVERSFAFPFQELSDQNCFTSLKSRRYYFLF
jgi:uncharacterized protein (DUF58 family)